jgi:hypothetical protein
MATQDIITPMQSRPFRPRLASVAELRALVSFMNQNSPLVSAPPLRLDPTDVVVATPPRWRCVA